MNQEKKKRVDASVPLVLRLQDKNSLVDFIENQIPFDNLCSEKLPDLYKAYRDFLEKEKTPSESLKRRAFKNTFLILIKNKGIYVTEYPSNTGIIIAGVGLKKPIPFLLKDDRQVVLV